MASLFPGQDGPQVDHDLAEFILIVSLIAIMLAAAALATEGNLLSAWSRIAEALRP